ncbi:DNA (cytosine-5-)-methyltransferase [Flavobacteriaceae bacterium F89]|uniref:Cytosine-specific methyltransferase n=1 Tax=Cerina litoralis TaxID=2874477 RepID=A0AAE3EQI4_9FLAO|nr:DNA (cytosine-5-)-methyltransferase [Cerina litoralis]MCG2459230.1 DNA (cytosine-5-)-methyltransferase [Cerina litoralis]
MNKLKVIELFAGVGGFRLGLEKTGHYEVVWSNQWEPSTKKQHASMVYEARFGPENHSNQDIAEVPVSEIPDADLLVGGFPCQDYSVATSLKNSKGLIGKKGVLWWSIHKILTEKKNKPAYLLLENVDRLLKSPAKQRGRDFALILKSLEDLGYAVEWRVINAADYGMPQRRRRIFILGYQKSTKIYTRLENTDPVNWIYKTGTMAHTFPVLRPPEHCLKTRGNLTKLEIKGNLVALSEGFNVDKKLSPFQNSGIFMNGKVITVKTVPDYGGTKRVLAHILQNGEVPDDFYIPREEYYKWEYLKGAKKETRKTAAGFEYDYSEGGLIFPDNLDNASRTIITGEGGKTPSRFKHVVQTQKGLRRLTPVELERLNMFPDDHTKLEGVTDAKRAFFMGNALVVGVVTQIGKTLFKENNI